MPVNLPHEIISVSGTSSHTYLPIPLPMEIMVMIVEELYYSALLHGCWQIGQFFPTVLLPFFVLNRDWNAFCRERGYRTLVVDYQSTHYLPTVLERLVELGLEHFVEYVNLALRTVQTLTFHEICAM
jgi:hypothetical protein